MDDHRISKILNNLIWTSVIMLGIWGIYLGILFYVNVLPTENKENQTNQAQKIQDQNPNTEQPKKYPKILTTSPIRGNPKAEITIVEFADFTCPYCAQAQPVLRQIQEIYKNRVKIVWKDFPLTGLRPDAKIMHIAARCAQAQNKFWDYHDLIFAHQNKISKQDYTSFALKLKMNGLEFNKCLDSKEKSDLIDQDIQEGLTLNITSTPEFYINNSRMSGLINVQEFQNMIDLELNK